MKRSEELLEVAKRLLAMDKKGVPSHSTTETGLEPALYRIASELAALRESQEAEMQALRKLLEDRLPSAPSLKMYHLSDNGTVEPV